MRAEETVAAMLKARGWHIAFAESCTGGLAVARLVGVAGVSDVLADRPDADGAYRYPLCDWERADLPRLHEKVLHGILLPADHRELLVP